MGFLIVFLGGGIGAALRHGVNLTSARLLGTAFPYHTMFENVSGSFVMGLLAGYFAFRGSATQHWQLFFTTGILGGYTTFSTYAVQTEQLLSGHPLIAAVYLIGTALFALLAVQTGVVVTRRLMLPRRED